MARLFSLQLSQEELNRVARAVDASLNVREALEKAETGGRARAIDALGGAQIMKDTRYPANVVKRCHIKLAAAPGGAAAAAASAAPKKQKKKSTNY